MGLAERCVPDQLEVPIRILLGGLFFGDDDDTGILGSFENRFKDRSVVGDDLNDIDLLGNQIFDRAHLLRRVIGGWRYHPGIDAQILASRQDALFDVVEPWNANLCHDVNLQRIVGSQCTAQAQRANGALSP